MKKLLALLAVVLAVVSCQREPEGLDVNVGGEQTVTVNVTIPEAETRAEVDKSAKGVFDNAVLDGDATMRYILQVYYKKDDSTVIKSDERQVKWSDGKTMAFDVRLVPGRDYQFVVWADVVKSATDTDNHYDTSDLTQIKLNDTWVAMDESRDAFTATVEVNDYSSSSNITVLLKRPFAKLRVVTTDIENLTNLGIVPTKATVIYKTGYRDTFNAVEGKAAAATTNKKEHTNFAIASYGESNTGDAYTLFTDYFFAEAGDVVKFDFDVLDQGNKSIKANSFGTEISVKRNYLTTIKGNILTDGKGFDVTIDDAFAGENEVDANIKEQLEEAAKYKNYVIDLEGDLIWETGGAHGSTPLIPEGAVTETLTINGNGYKVIATGAGVGPIRMANGGKLIFNEVTLVDQTKSYAEDSWEFGYLEVAGNLEFNNCVIDNTIAIDGEKAVFNNCTFNDKVFAGTDGQEYAAWVSNGEVEFNGCKFSGARGIKVHEAYGSEVAEVVVDNCQFNNLSKKPGMAIGTVNTATKIEIKNSVFNNCQPGDQGLFMYETDTNFATFDFSQTNNTVNAPVTTQESLEKLLKSDLKEINVTLEADAPINVQDAYIKLGGANTERIVIDGKKLASASATGAAKGNHKLTLATTYWSRLNTVNPDAVLVLKNLALTSSQETGTWNSYDVTFQCNVELENVELLKAVAFDGAGKSVKVKNVTIKESHDYYAMWIAAAGQTVDVENLVIESAGRGIKIDDQYVNDAVAKVTLNIDGLKVKSQNKAAIMVKSTKGADINIKNIDITEVADDTKNAVWVDEDAADYATLVNVTGASMFTEGADVIDGNDALEDVKIENNSIVYLGEGEYVIPAAAQGKTVKFVGTGNPEDTKVAVTKVGTGGENCDYGLDGSTVTFENITITTNSSTYIGYARCNGTYKNCIINGTYTLYGDSVFEDCTFNVSGDVYNIWTWGAKNISFERCTFNSDGKALLLYQEGTNTIKLNVATCIFNDNGALADLKAAIEIGDAPYGATPTYYVNVSDTKVNGYEINDKGIYTGTTLWANKNSMPAERLIVTVDGYTWVADGVAMNAEGEYLITKAAGLTWFSDQLNNKKNTFAGKTIKVVNDIDMAGVTYYGGSVASYPSYCFKGTFDGGEKVISNLTITVEDDIYGAAALIPTLAGDGTTIKNVILRDVNISSSHYAAGIWGYTTSENCWINVTNCHVEGGTITGNICNGDNADKVGGIGGIFYDGIVSGCSVKGVTITAYRDAAGIVGWAADSRANIKNNSIENVTINVNNATNYKNYTKRSDYDVNNYVGEGVGKAKLEGNTGEATINWGSITE